MKQLSRSGDGMQESLVNDLSLYAIVYNFRGMNWGVFMASGWFIISWMMAEKRRKKGTRKIGSSL